MKVQVLIRNLISTFKTKLIKNNNNNKHYIPAPQSDKLEKKLALLIKDIEAVDQADLKHVEYKKMDKGTKNDLFSSCRLDFHTRMELDSFKKKYQSLLL